MSKKKIEQVTEQAKQTAESAQSIVIEQPKVRQVALEIAGTAGLIMNDMGQKVVEEILRKQMGFSVQREKKRPSDCIERAITRNMNKEPSVKPTAVKMAMLSASTQIKGLKKTQLRTGLYVCGNSLPIKYREMRPRMDPVRLQGIGRTVDIRFRPEFVDWSLRLVIEHSDQFPVQTVVDLLNRAGSVGLGEWRPERNGTFGTFQVVRNIETAREIEEVLAASASPIMPLIIPEWALNADIDPEVLQRMMNEATDGGGSNGESDDENALDGAPAA